MFSIDSQYLLTKNQSTEAGVGNHPETGGTEMEFPVSDGADLLSPPSVPPRLRLRLTESKASTSSASIKGIEAKLRNADLRRQKFYRNVSSKAKLQAAEQERMQILKAHSHQRATSRAVYPSISMKCEAGKKKALDQLLQVKKVAKFVSQQQEIERLKLSKSLDDKPQRRADYHMQKGSPCDLVGVNWNKKTQKQANHLSRNLLRCWRKFLKQKTTLDLVKRYHLLNINASQLKSMPFEHFAIFIDNSSTLGTTKALLDRLETRYRVLISLASGNSLDDINHLLTRVVKTSVKISRYQPRIMLSAYIILSHPAAVFSGQGLLETNLYKSAKKFIQEFELLIDIMLNPSSKSSGEESGRCTFRSQLAAFDAAWCSYLNSFVVWKVKDVKCLEEDLARAACQMEISMMHKYKPTPEVGHMDSILTHDVKSFQKQVQVTEHQKLLRDNLLQLSGEAGIERLRIALSDTRRKYFKSKDLTI